jgi:nucleoside-diphosphate-sugar epimerase
MKLAQTINPVLYQELEALVDTQKLLVDQFTGKTVMITGATGLLGRSLVLTFLAANELRHTAIQVIAVARNQQKVASQYGKLCKLPELTFCYQDLMTPFDANLTPDYIFHTAAVTDGRQLKEFPVETFSAQFTGMMNVLKLAEAVQAKVVYLSSMEIYGQPFTDGRATEKDVGYVDPLVIRNGYPESKRANEFLASAFASEYNVQVVNARLAQTFGPGVAPDDHRVFAQFARSVIKGDDIVLQTDGSSSGNYSYLFDTIAGLLLLAKQGEQGQSYNIVNESASVTIKQLAELVATFNDQSHVVVRIPEDDPSYAPKVSLKLSAKKLEALGWRPTKSLKEMFVALIASWESTNE